jgi:hypothetical protein
MSSVYHTPYEDDVTQFKASHMNIPLGELDAQMDTNVIAIALRLQVGDFVVDDADGQIVVDDADGEPVVDM